MSSQLPIPINRGGKLNKSEILRRVLESEQKGGAEYDPKRILFIATKTIEQYPPEIRRDIIFSRIDIISARRGMVARDARKRGVPIPRTDSGQPSIILDPSKDNLFSHSPVPEAVLFRGRISKCSLLNMVIEELSLKGEKISPSTVLPVAEKRLKIYPKEQTKGIEITRVDFSFARKVYIAKRTKEKSVLRNSRLENSTPLNTSLKVTFPSTPIWEQIPLPPVRIEGVNKGIAVRRRIILAVMEKIHPGKKYSDLESQGKREVEQVVGKLLERYPADQRKGISIIPRDFYRVYEIHPRPHHNKPKGKETEKESSISIPQVKEKKSIGDSVSLPQLQAAKGLLLLCERDSERAKALIDLLS